MSYSFSLFMNDFASSKLAKISNSLNSIQGKTQKTNTEFKNLGNKPKPGFLGNLKRINSEMGGMLGLAGGVGLAFSAWNGIKTVFNKGVELEQMNTKFEVLLGSVSKGQKMLGELNEFANFTPFSNQSIIKSAELQLAFGVGQEQIMTNMQRLGDLSMGNEQRLNSLSLAYSQVKSAGRLMGQDLLQMINQGFNPLQVISENTGLSMLTLKKRMEQGAISAEMVDEAMRLATSAGGKFNGMSEKMAKTGGGKLSTLLGKLSFVLMEVGKRFVDWVKPILDVGITVVDNIIPFFRWVRDFLPTAENFKLIMQVTAVVMTALGLNFLIANANLIAFKATLLVVNGIMKVVTIATQLWNFVLSLNPIGIVILAIGALIAAVVVLWQKFDWFRGSIMGVWEVLKSLGTVIKEFVINRFKELLSGITGIGSALVAFFQGDWQKAWEIGQKAGQDLLGKNSKAKLIKNGIDAFKDFNAGYEKGAKEFEPKVAVKSKKANENILGNQEKSSLFNSLVNAPGANNKALGKSNQDATKGKVDSVISGGKRTTNINVNIQNLGTETKIFVDKTEKGVSDFGRMVREELLRVVNSVNQMQTA